jgi:hypothetical protein
MIDRPLMSRWPCAIDGRYRLPAVVDSHAPHRSLWIGVKCIYPVGLKAPMVVCTRFVMELLSTWGHNRYLSPKCEILPPLAQKHWQPFFRDVSRFECPRILAWFWDQCYHRRRDCRCRICCGFGILVCCVDDNDANNNRYHHNNSSELCSHFLPPFFSVLPGTP